jgi:hypothetical protein
MGWTHLADMKPYHGFGCREAAAEKIKELIKIVMIMWSIQLLGLSRIKRDGFRGL